MRTVVSRALSLLMGCGSMYTSIDNGQQQIPGLSVDVTTRVLKW